MKKTFCSVLMLLAFTVTLHKACELIINTEGALSLILFTSLCPHQLHSVLVSSVTMVNALDLS